MGDNLEDSNTALVDLYLGNLPYSVTRDDLARLFRDEDGKLMIRVNYDRDTNKSRGFGFATFPSHEEALAIKRESTRPAAHPQIRRV